MKYNEGDIVEVCSRKGGTWYEGKVLEATASGYLIKFSNPPLSSVYLGVKRPAGRDHKVDNVRVPLHLENVGVGWQSLRLKSRKK